MMLAEWATEETISDPERIVRETGDLPVLNATQIDRILADFRSWLEPLTQLPAVPPQVEPLNLQAVLAQFTALRHEVNLQTKASRSAVEQTGAALKLLQEPPPESEDEEEEKEDLEYLRPIVKMTLDLHDALSVAKKQMEKAKANATDLTTAVGPPPELRIGFFARLLGVRMTASFSDDWQEYLEKIEAHHQKIREQFTGVADGYTMSLRRIERVFPQLGLVPMNCLGQPFDPEKMEVLDTESHPDSPSGTILEVVRQGYHWQGNLFRYAQVKVAK
jgi:molecular chaperone GrpE